MLWIQQVDVEQIMMTESSSLGIFSSVVVKMFVNYLTHAWATACRMAYTRSSTGYHSCHLIRTEVLFQPRIHQFIIITILKCSH
jgi:hypothetical protein